MTYYEERQEVERKKNEKLERELAFNKQFRARVQEGYSKDQFIKDYAPTSDQLAEFDRLTSEVQDEAMHDALFLQGFTSVPVRRF